MNYGSRHDTTQSKASIDWIGCVAEQESSRVQRWTPCSSENRRWPGMAKRRMAATVAQVTSRRSSISLVVGLVTAAVMAALGRTTRSATSMTGVEQKHGAVNTGCGTPAFLTTPGLIFQGYGQRKAGNGRLQRHRERVIRKQQVDRQADFLKQDLFIDTEVSRNMQGDNGLLQTVWHTVDDDDAAADDRKLRSAIESIARDQQALRTDAVPLNSRQTILTAATALLLAVTACASATVPVWHVALVPAITSGLFLQTSSSESAGTRSRGLARHHAGQAVALTSQQEALLAQAEARKAFLPFGVGLTAIFAAACVTLKLFNEKIGDLIPEDTTLNPPLLAADNFLMIFFAVSAVVGAMSTSDAYIKMRACVQYADTASSDDPVASWEVPLLNTKDEEQSLLSRSATALLTLVVCLCPSLVTGNLAALLNIPSARVFQEQVDSTAVVISATAGALSAIVFLLAELQFTDAEQRTAWKCKQAGLSEVFFAQTTADSAAVPMRSAWVGMVLAAASLSVEVSQACSGILPLAAMLSPLRAFFDATVSSASAEASWLERQVQLTGRKGVRKQNVLSTAGREISRFLSGLVETNEFATGVRRALVSLPVGASTEFKALNSESRRKVHLIAAELGMYSKSVAYKRMVSVTNFGGAKVQHDAELGLQALVETARSTVDAAGKDLGILIERGIPTGEGATLVPALAATATGVVAPLVLAKDPSDFIIPLLTGGIGLATTWQEQVGSETVARAKKSAADMKTQVYKAESLLGRAVLGTGPFPSYFSVAIAATTLSVLTFFEHVPLHMWWINAILAVVSAFATALTARRQKRVGSLVRQASMMVQGSPPPRDWVSNRRWWIAPLTVALALPVDLPRRLAVASVVLATEIGIMMSSSFTQIAAAEFYTARAQRVFAHADAWMQEATAGVRALPKQSAAAVVTTLLAIALPTLGSIFPLVSMGICLQAVRFRSVAGRSAKRAEVEVIDMQTLGSEMPPFPSRAVEPELQEEVLGIASMKSRLTTLQNSFLDDVMPLLMADLKNQDCSPQKLCDMLCNVNDEITWESFRDFFSRFDNGKFTDQQVKRLWLIFEKGPTGMSIPRAEFEAVLSQSQGMNSRILSRMDFRRPVSRLSAKFMGTWDEVRADDYYTTRAAEQAVQSVHASLSELRLSARSSEKDFLRTGVTVGAAVSAALLAPFMLSEVLTELLLPVVGATLVLFCVDQEAAARTKIAAAKVWSAALNEIEATREESLAIGCLYKARLISAAGFSVGLAITTIVLEDPFALCQTFPSFTVVQDSIRWVLILAQMVYAVWSVGRCMTVLEYARRVSKRAAAYMPRRMETREETPKMWFRGMRERGSWDSRLPPVLAMIPGLLLAFFPSGRHFGQRAVASTAAGALVVAVALYVAERAMARAEVIQATRKRTAALSDTFCEAAEQQGAVLPFISAASIAIAGIITFGTELNPFYASGLTLLQALGWIVSSRKGSAAKFESEGALMVNLSSLNPRSTVGLDPLKRFKRWIMG